MGISTDAVIVIPKANVPVRTDETNRSTSFDFSFAGSRIPYGADDDTLRSNVGTNSRKWRYFTVIGGIGLFVWLLASPWFIVPRLQEAALNGDEEALADLIDFPALRTSLKDEFNGMVASRTVRSLSENPGSTLGGVLAAGLASYAIDQLVNPKSISALFKGKQIPNLPSAIDVIAKNMVTDQKNRGKEMASISYESYDRFAVSPAPTNTASHRVKLIFTRSRVFSWRLTGIRLLEVNPASLQENTVESTSGRTTGKFASPSGPAAANDDGTSDPILETLAERARKKIFLSCSGGHFYKKLDWGRWQEIYTERPPLRLQKLEVSASDRLNGLTERYAVTYDLQSSRLLENLKTPLDWGRWSDAGIKSDWFLPQLVRENGIYSYFNSLASLEDTEDMSDLYTCPNALDGVPDPKALNGLDP